MSRTKRNRGYGVKKKRSNRMYAPCRTGKTVTDEEVARSKRDAANDPDHNFGPAAPERTRRFAR